MRHFLLGLFAVLLSSGAFGKTLYTFNGGGTTGDWNTPTTWTTDPTGSTSIGAALPTSADDAVVTNSFVVTLSSLLSAGVTPISITIQKGGVLDLVGITTTSGGFSGTLATLAGQGTLRIGRAYFPAVTNNNFDDANTGTVEYYNWTASANLPEPAVFSQQYNNLRLVNTTTGTAFTASINSTLLTVKGNLTLINGNFVSGATPVAATNLTLNLGTSGTTGSLIVDGNITVGGATVLGVPAVNGSRTLTANGNFINSGTVTLWVNDAQAALLLFGGSKGARFACNGPTDLGTLQVNKGLNSQVLLDITATTAGGGPTASNLRLNTTATGVNLLDITNGVVKLGNNIYLPKIVNGNNASFNLGSATATPTLWLAGATVLLNSPALDLQVYGKLHVTGGELDVLGGKGVVLREEGEILIDGGNVFTEIFEPYNSTKTPRGSFTITDGVFDCSGTVTNGQSSRFALPFKTQSFRMAGGTIRLANSIKTTGTYHIGVDPDNALITGGTVEINMPPNGADCNILTTVPVWNLVINKASSTNVGVAKLTSISLQAAGTSGTGVAVTAAQPLTVLNDFTMSNVNTSSTATSTFDANSQNLTIQGTFSIGTNCIYLPTTNTTTFSGGQNQLLTNDGAINNLATANTFYNWVINKPAGTLTLGGAGTTFHVAGAGVLSLLSGVLNDGGKTVNVLGNMVNSASHTSGGGLGSITLFGSTAHTVSGNGNGVFGNLKLNSTATSGTVAATFTANMSVASVLTFSSNHILAIGSNRLALTNVSSGALVGTFSSNRFIQTAGNQSDLGLQKTWGGNLSFVFPVGVGTKYTPATINLSTATALVQYGQVSVSPANLRNPFATGSSNAANYFWKVRSANFSTIPNGSIAASFQMYNSDAAGTLANYVPGRYLPVAWTNYGAGLVTTDVTPTGTAISNISFPALGQFEGEFTAGEASAFGTVTAYYSIKNGNWTDTNLGTTPWSTTPGGAAVATTPGAGNPVFIGAADATTPTFHKVTVIANAAKAGSLVIDRGSVLDVQTFTGHNFGELPDAKVGGSGRLRVSTTAATAVFPGGDFGTFLQPNGGTVEYYTQASGGASKSFIVPTTSETSLALGTYQNLSLNATSGNTITLPALDLRIYSQMVTGTPTTFPGDVNLTATAGTQGDLRIGSLLNVAAGNLHYPTANARSITADANVQVDAGATFDVPNSGNGSNALSVGGTLTNNGILNLNTTFPPTTNTGAVNLTFTGAQNNSFTGTGTATTIKTLTLNKGNSRTPTLTVDVAGTLSTPVTPTNGWLTLSNGTFRYARPNSTLIVHDGTSAYSITDNAGLTVDAAAATVTVATNATSIDSDLKLAGELQVKQGTLNIGTATGAGNDLEYASAGAPTVRVSTGGTLFVNGQVRRNLSNTSGSLRYIQAGGTTEVAGFGATGASSSNRGLFEVQGLSSIFRMTGGTLALRRSNGQPTIISDLYLRPDSTLVTAGAVLLGNNVAGVRTPVSVSSSVPLYDLQVEAGIDAANPNVGMLSLLIPLTLKGSLTIANNNAVFNANGQDLNIDQDLVNNNSSINNNLNDGSFRPFTATQTTTFTGKGTATQLLSSTATANPTTVTVFGNLVLNNAQPSGTLQLGRDVRVFGTLTLTKGTLADGGQTITALGDVVNSATHTGTGRLVLGGAVNQNIDGNGTGRFGNVTLNNTLNNATGATLLANQEITGQLTLSSGVLTIGSNLLLLSNPLLTSVAGTFDANHHIRTNGIVADLGLRKSYPSGAHDFTFPVGASGKYTPVRMNVTSNGATGTLTVQPVDRAHPSTTNPAPFELNYYWKVASTGFSAPTVSQEFAYVATDVNGTEGNYKVGRFLSGAWVPLNGIATSTVNVSTHRLSNAGANYFDGDYTGADANAVPSEFGGVPTYYSRNATSGGNWEVATSWTQDPTSDVASATSPSLANPVVIRTGHTITAIGPSLGAASLVLNGTLDLAANGGNNFSVVTGSGTLRIGSALFPAGNYKSFVSSGGGTVDFTASGQLPARDTYNNLTLSGNNTIKQLSNLDLTINGTLALNSGTTVTNSTNQSLTLTSATSGAVLGGVFNLNDGALTTASFVNNTGTLTLGAGLVNVGTTFSNAGTVNNGSADVKVGTSFANSGTYNANKGAGGLAVGTNFANSGTYNAGAGTLDVSGDFNNTAGSFNAASGDVNVGGNFANTATYIGGADVMRVVGSFANGGTYNASASTMVFKGNFTNTTDFNFNPSSSLAQFLVDANHTLTGNTSFNNLQKLGTSALLLGPTTDVTVKTLLNLQSGVILTGTVNKLILKNTAMQPIVGTGTGAYVAGRLQMELPVDIGTIREFPVGLGGRFRPVTVTIGATGSSAPVVLVEMLNVNPYLPLSFPNGTDGSVQNISKVHFYRIQATSGTLAASTIQLSFNTDVVSETITVPGNLRVAHYKGNNMWGTDGVGGSGVFSPETPRGYVISGLNTIDNTAQSFFTLGSTNSTNNPLNNPTPLPVELTHFTATPQGSAARLLWATAMEKNSAYFAVQRSADGSSFTDIDRVEAQGNSSTRHDYTMLDNTPLAGLNYYRLRQVDADGTASYSPVRTVRFEGGAAKPSLLAYPNPASPKGFRLRVVNSAVTGGTVQVFDNVGRLVFTQVAASGAADATVEPARPLASGMYFATWQSPDGAKLTTKVVVE